MWIGFSTKVLHCISINIIKLDYPCLLASAASRVAFITFSNVRALARSPLILTLPVIKALAGANSPKKFQELKISKLKNQYLICKKQNLRLKIFRKTSSFIEMVTSALLGGSPSPTAPVPFLKSMKYFPTPENHIYIIRT